MKKSKKTVKRPVKKTTKVKAKARVPTPAPSPAPLQEPAGITIPTELPQPIVKEQTAAMTVIGKALLLDVRTAQDAVDAASLLVTIKDFEKQLKQRQDFLLAPVKAAGERIKALFTPAMKQLEEAERGVKLKLSIYAAEQSRRQAEERQKLLAAAVEANETGDSETAADLATSAASIMPEAKTKHVEGGGAVRTTMVWKFKVTDASKVPREYLEVSDKLVRAAIRNGIREVAGLEIFQEPQLAVYTSASSSTRADYDEVPF
jgi:hypothetical protein